MLFEMKTQNLLFSVWLPKMAYYRAKYHIVPFIRTIYREVKAAGFNFLPARKKGSCNKR